MELFPYFGCGPHVPPKPLAKGEKRRRCPACRTKDGVAPEGSRMVCMTCFSTAPSIQTALGISKAAAIRSREPEARVVEANARDIRSSRKSSADRSSLTLTHEERRQLVAEAVDPVFTRSWLDSIGQPLDGDDEIQENVPKKKPVWRRKRQAG